MRLRRGIAIISALLCAGWPLRAALHTTDPNVTIVVLEGNGRKPLPSRIHLTDQAGKVVRADPLPFWRDHFVHPGTVELALTPGRYHYEIERGPEYEKAAGSFEVETDRAARVELRLPRRVDLQREGWWSGDLHVHRPVRDLELLMQAEHLHVAPVITWWNNRNLWSTEAMPEQRLLSFEGPRFAQVMAGEDEREGGALLFFHLQRPLAIAGSTREYPSPMKFVEAARAADPQVWIDVEKPFWWDMPIWVALARPDSIGLANNHMCRSQMYESEAWGRPRDLTRLPPPRGNGFWSQEIYYHLLNCGLRIPPSAGSASGVLPNPVGYNQVYVHVDGRLTHEKWWEGLRAGRSFVTNGPLLRVRASGRFPGHVFTGRPGRTLRLDLRLKLDTREAIEGLELVQNGSVRRLETTTSGDHSANLEFTESGWFLVRVITSEARTFRFASTAPFYVEIGEPRRPVRRASAEFFLNWVRERKARVKLDEPQQLSEVLAYHQQAEQFWTEQVAGSVP